MDDREKPPKRLKFPAFLHPISHVIPLFPNPWNYLEIRLGEKERWHAIPCPFPFPNPISSYVQDGMDWGKGQEERNGGNDKDGKDWVVRKRNEKRRPNSEESILHSLSHPGLSLRSLSGRAFFMSLHFPNSRAKASPERKVNWKGRKRTCHLFLTSPWHRDY